MRNYKFLSYLIIGVLLACDIALICIVRKNKIEADSSIAAMYPYCTKYAVLRSNAEAVIKYSARAIQDCDLTDADCHSLMISNLFDGGREYLLILRISDAYCNSCVRYAVDLFSKLQLKKNFVCIAGLQNPAHLKTELGNLNIPFSEVYNIPFIDSPIDCAGFPYLMVLNRNLEIEYCYFPNKGNEQIDLENINMIIDCYAKKYGTVE